MNSPLIKKPIIDKNGVATTRNVRADDGATKSAKRVSKVKAPGAIYPPKVYDRILRLSQQTYNIATKPVWSFAEEGAGLGFGDPIGVNEDNPGDGTSARDAVIEETHELMQSLYPEVVTEYHNEVSRQESAIRELKRQNLDLMLFDMPPQSVPDKVDPVYALEGAMSEWDGEQFAALRVYDALLGFEKATAPGNENIGVRDLANAVDAFVRSTADLSLKFDGAKERS